MQFSRRWSLVAGVLLAAGFVGSSSTFGAINLSAEAAKMETAKGADAVAVKTTVLAAAPATMVDKNKYGRDVAVAFAPELKSKNPDAQLNTAILLASLQALFMDSTLEDMLKNPNPAVRYWGAKGLGDIMDTLKSVGGATMGNAQSALTTGIAGETSGLVKYQMAVALGKSGDPKAMLKALTVLTGQLANGGVDSDTLEATAVTLSSMETALKSGSTLAKADLDAVAKSAAWSASFAAQEQVLVKASRASEGSDFPKAYSTASLAVVNNAVKVLNGLPGGGSLKMTAADDSPEGLQFGVDALVGSAGAGPGDLQKVMTTVPVPPVVKK